MNWGYRITLVFIGFAGFILYLVFQSFNQTVDLVSEDYYQQEIEYEKQMTRIKNSNSLVEKMVCSQNNNQIVIQFPGNLKNNQIKGVIHLFRPSDAARDFSLPIKLSEEGIQYVEKKNMLAGMYKIKVNWSFDGDDYFFEEVIHI